MEKHLTSFVLVLMCISSLAQKSSSPQSGFTINPNDTSYFRIFNGIILANGYVVKEFGSYESISDQKRKEELGIKTTLPLMLINIKSFPIEYKIDSILYSRPTFIDSYKFPSTIQLPISINSKLLTYEDRQKLLPKMILSEIKEINYIDTKTAMTKYGVTPFGVIDLVLK